MTMQKKVEVLNITGMVILQHVSESQMLHHIEPIYVKPRTMRHIMNGHLIILLDTKLFK